MPAFAWKLADHWVNGMCNLHPRTRNGSGSQRIMKAVGKKVHEAKTCLRIDLRTVLAIAWKRGDGKQGSQ